MDILGTLIVGIIAGWGASRLMGSRGYGVIGYIVVGILGAVVGGWLASRLLGIDVASGLNLTAIAVSVVSAAILIVLFRVVAPRRRTL